MKKLSAILLIIIFLFNLFGYRLLFNFAQQQSDIKLEASLDKDDFNEAELITLQVPLSLPYLTNQQNFERVDGEITVDGKIYKYVKRKITDGNLVLLCLPHHNKMRIESAKDEFFKYANDLVQNNNSKKSGNSKAGVFKNVLAEYDNYVVELTTTCSSADIIYGVSKYLHHLPTSPHASPEQPPELI